MKSAGLLTLLLTAASALGQVVVPAQEAASAPTYQLRPLQASAHSLQGKLIKLQFITRASVTENTPDGGVTGEVVDSPSTRITVNVQIPKAAVSWFMNLPTTYKGGPPYTIYARLSTDKFGAPIALLLGRQTHPDTGGTRIDW